MLFIEQKQSTDIYCRFITDVHSPILYFSLAGLRGTGSMPSSWHHNVFFTLIYMEEYLHMAYFRETLPKCVRARRESVSPSSLAHLFSAFQRTPMIFESRDSVSLSLFVCVSFRFSSIRFDSKWSRRQKHHVLFAAIRFIDDAFLLAFSALALVLFSLLAFVNNGRLVSKYL